MGEQAQLATLEPSSAIIIRINLKRIGCCCAIVLNVWHAIEILLTHATYACLARWAISICAATWRSVVSASITVIIYSVIADFGCIRVYGNIIVLTISIVE